MMIIQKGCLMTIFLLTNVLLVSILQLPLFGILLWSR